MEHWILLSPQKTRMRSARSEGVGVMAHLHLKKTDFLHKDYSNCSTAALDAQAQTLAVREQCWSFGPEVCFIIRCLKMGHCVRVLQIQEWG